MAKIAETAESTIDYYTAFQHDHTKMEPNVINAVCASAYSAAEYLDAAAIIVMTSSGRTARTLSSFHPPCPIIAVTIDDIGLHQLKLTWNVTPIAAKELDSPDALLDHALAKAKETKVVKKGDKVIALLASDIRCDNNIMRICIVE
jgi:pyruvate kinase